jgi:hypothetical protein
MPDHAPRHDDPLQSTTPTGNWDKATLGSGETWTPPTSGGGGSARPLSHVAYVPTERSVWFAVVLTAAFGPFGVFRAGFLHGAAALVFTWTAASAASAGRLEPINVLYALFWVTLIPWVVIALNARNRRIARGNAASATP